jgi:hypothetical protein
MNNSGEDSVAARRSEDNAGLVTLVALLTADAQRIAFPTNIMEKVTAPTGEFTGLRFRLRNTFYCAQPISCISEISASLGGMQFTADHILLILRGQVISANYAPTFHELWWGFGEVLEILIDLSGSAGRNPSTIGRLNLELFLRMRTSISYGLSGDAYCLHLKNEMEVR